MKRYSQDCQRHPKPELEFAIGHLLDLFGTQRAIPNEEVVGIHSERVRIIFRAAQIEAQSGEIAVGIDFRKQLAVAVEFNFFVCGPKYKSDSSAVFFLDIGCLRYSRKSF